MYWVNSVLWQLRIGKSLRNSLFQGLVFGLIFRSCKDYFFSFFCWRGSFFHRNVIGFQFSAKKIFAKCNCFDNCQTMFLSKLYLLILMPLSMYSIRTRIKYDTFLLMSFVNSFIFLFRFLQKNVLKVFALKPKQ